MYFIRSDFVPLLFTSLVLRVVFIALENLRSIQSPDFLHSTIMQIENNKATFFIGLACVSKSSAFLWNIQRTRIYYVRPKQRVGDVLIWYTFGQKYKFLNAMNLSPLQQFSFHFIKATKLIIIRIILINNILVMCIDFKNFPALYRLMKLASNGIHTDIKRKVIYYLGSA